MIVIIDIIIVVNKIWLYESKLLIINYHFHKLNFRFEVPDHPYIQPPTHKTQLYFRNAPGAQPDITD